MTIHFNDPNLLTLFGTVLGVIGSLLLSIDALGAPDFLAALKSQQEKGIRMARIGFLALINRTFVYLFIACIGFVVALVASRGHVVASLLIAPFVFFAWKVVIYIAERSEQVVKRLGPSDYLKDRQGLLYGLGCVLYFLHWAIWALIYLVVFLVALLVRFGLDLPLTYLSEKAMVPIFNQVYLLSAKVVADEEKWKLKSTALIGSLFILFGFMYQFIGTFLLTKW